MLSREEMMILIDANDELEEIGRIIGELSHAGQLREDKFRGLMKIGDLIYHNSSLYVKDDDKAFARFYAIVTNTKLCIEEMYNMLTKDETEETAELPGQ